MRAIEHTESTGAHQEDPMAVVVRNTQRTDLELVDALGHFGVATIHEAQGRTGLLRAALAPDLPTRARRGNALTCEVAPGDNWSIHVAVEQAQPGRHPGRHPDESVRRRLLRRAARDQPRSPTACADSSSTRACATSRELTAMGFPVWSKTISAQGTVKETPGNVQTPIVCAGAYVRPGDVIVADDDGVVVVAARDAATVLDGESQREENEAEQAPAPRGGRTRSRHVRHARQARRSADFATSTSSTT